MKNTKKRFLIAILCILLSVSFVISCNTVPAESGGGAESSTPTETPAETPNETPVETPTETTPDVPTEYAVVVDLSGYTMVYPANASKELKSAVIEKNEQLNTKFGINMPVGTDSVVTEKEILVGTTSRDESEKALEGVPKDSFVIAVLGNKIVINSAEDELIAEGLGYFLRELDGMALSVDGSTLVFPEGYRYVSPEYTPFVLWSSLGTESTTVIYGKNQEYGMTTGNADRTLTEVTLADEVAKRLKLLAAGKTVSYVGSTPEESSEIEICIGDAGREECGEFLSSLAYNEYGFAIKNGKIVIMGSNLTTLDLAVDMFIEYINGSVVVEDVKYRAVTLRDNVCRTAFADQWVVDIPEFEGGKYAGTYDSDLGRLLIYFTDTTPEAFESYCKKLEGAGYRLWQRNDIEKNLHAGYLNKDNFIYVYYTAYERAVRIITSPAEGLVLPDASEIDGESLVDTTITQIRCDNARGNYGMGYIIRLEDGSFIVIDGGDHGESVEKGTGGKRIYDKLCELNAGKGGEIVIAAWILTHFHVDHYGAFRQFCMQYGQKVTIEKVMFNTAPKECIGDRFFPNNIEKMQNAVRGGFDTVELLTGMKFYVRNAEFEVLCTNDDIYPRRNAADNDTTTVTRMKVDGQTVMWLGDGQDLVSNTLCFRYGGYLKSDIVQVAHHGGWGGSFPLYALIKAHTVLWPTNARSSYEKQLKTSYKYYNSSKQILKYAKEIYVAGDGDVTILKGK